MKNKVVISATDQKLKKLQKNPARNKFAIIFIQVRTQLGHQQTYFAGILGVTQGTISKIESGTMLPDVNTYLKFSRKYKVEVL